MDQFQAAKTGDLDWFREHEKNGTLPDLMKVDNMQWLPHDYACRYGHFPIVRFLLEETLQSSQIDVTVRNNYVVRTAAAYGHLEIVRYLVDECPKKDSVDVSAHDNHALQLAAEHGSLDVLKFLVEDCSQKERVDVAVQNNYALRWAITNGHFEIVKYFLEESSQKKRIDEVAKTAYPFYVNSAYQHSKLTEYLNLTKCAEFSIQSCMLGWRWIARVKRVDNTGTCENILIC